MNEMLAHLKSFPGSAKNGIILLYAGWLWHFFAMYRYFLDGEIPERQLVIGIAVCAIVFKARNWARVLCILGNAVVILQYLPLVYAFFMAGNAHLGTIAAISVALFGASAAYLLMPSSAAFYKKHALPAKNEADDGGRGSQKPAVKTK